MKNKLKFLNKNFQKKKNNMIKIKNNLVNKI